MTDSEHRALEIHEITFDARDPHALAAFWAALLEREVRPGDMPQDDSVLVAPVPGQPGLLFLRVPEGNKTVPKIKNKLHLDLRVGEEDVDAVVAKLKERGATFLWNGQQGPHTWVTMADPEGNEFCVSR